MKGLKSALQKARGANIALDKGARRAIGDAADAALLKARALAPVQTGRLRDSLRARRDGLQSAVKTDCPYARAAERLSPYLAPAARRADLTKRCEQALREAFHD